MGRVVERSEMDKNSKDVKPWGCDKIIDPNGIIVKWKSQAVLFWRWRLSNGTTVQLLPSFPRGEFSCNYIILLSFIDCFYICAFADFFTLISFHYLRPTMLLTASQFFWQTSQSYQYLFTLSFSQASDLFDGIKVDHTSFRLSKMGNTLQFFGLPLKSKIIACWSPCGNTHWRFRTNCELAKKS